MAWGAIRGSRQGGGMRSRGAPLLHAARQRLAVASRGSRATSAGTSPKARGDCVLRRDQAEETAKAKASSSRALPRTLSHRTAADRRPCLDRHLAAMVGDIHVGADLICRACPRPPEPRPAHRFISSLRLYRPPAPKPSAGFSPRRSKPRRSPARLFGSRPARSPMRKRSSRRFFVTP